MERRRSVCKKCMNGLLSSLSRSTGSGQVTPGLSQGKEKDRSPSRRPARRTSSSPAPRRVENDAHRVARDEQLLVRRNDPRLQTGLGRRDLPRRRGGRLVAYVVDDEPEPIEPLADPPPD